MVCFRSVPSLNSENFAESTEVEVPLLNIPLANIVETSVTTTLMKNTYCITDEAPKVNQSSDRLEEHKPHEHLVATIKLAYEPIRSLWALMSSVQPTYLIQTWIVASTSRFPSQTGHLNCPGPKQVRGTLRLPSSDLTGPIERGRGIYCAPTPT